MRYSVLLVSLVASTVFLPGCWMFAINTTTITATDPVPTDGGDIDPSTLLPVQKYDNKHDNFKGCLKFALDPDEFVMFENGTAYVEAYNMTYNSSFYQYVDGMLKVCIPHVEDPKEEDENEYMKFPPALTYVTVIGLVVSILCLFFHLVVFCMFAELRNLPGYNTASLALSLLMGYVCFLTSHTDVVTASPIPCRLFAAATQFFMMAAFLWMSAMAFDIFRSMQKATGKLRLATTRFNVKRYCFYCLYSWGTPVVFVIVTHVLDHVEGVPEDFLPMIGNEICWFNQRKPLLYLFAVPLFIVAVMNVVFFGLSAHMIYTNRMRTEQAAYQDLLKKYLVMYFRLSAIMGLTWVAGVVVGVVNAMWLWYVFALLNTLQGFFIFVAFTCTDKVVKGLKDMFVVRIRKMSCQSSTPTFQTYCNAGFTSDIGTKCAYENDGSPLTMKKIIENSIQAMDGAPRKTSK